MKAGSVGNTQERCCQGLSASSLSQRAIVEADASLIPRSTTSRCSSDREKRDSGSPCSLGNSQAIACTRATSSGGKTARATRQRSILEPRQPLVVEASSPASDDLRRDLQPAGDLHVRQPLGRVQDHLRPLHNRMRERVTRDPPLKLSPLLAAQNDPVRASSRHRRNRFAATTHLPQALPNFRPGALSDQANRAAQADCVLTRHRLNHPNPPLASRLRLAKPADGPAPLRRSIRLPETKAFSGQ